MDFEELNRTLGRIEGKQDALCKKIDEVHSDVNGKVSWRVFLAAVTLIFITLSACFSYTYTVQDNLNAHKDKVVWCQKNYNSAVEFDED